MSTDFASSSWFRFAFPILLLITVWIGIDNLVMVVQSNIGFAQNLPYVLFVSAIAIAHLFKQSRIAMIASVLLVSYLIVQYRLQSPLSDGSTLLELSLLATLLPVACLISYAFYNQGLATRSFAKFIGLLLMLLLWGMLSVTHFYDGSVIDLHEGLLYSVPQISRLPFILVLYLFALVGVCAILVLTRNRMIDATIYSALLLTSTTFIFFHVSFISSILFSLAGVLLILYLIAAGHALAFNDRLTQLPARHALDLDLQRLGKNFTIAMVDVDHFKAFNDTYGHETGDDVLKLVASRLRLVPGNGRAYRYGGEEFTLLFKGKTAEQAKPHLEWLRHDIEHYDLVIRDTDTRPANHQEGSKKRKRHKASSVTITISIGICDSHVEPTPKSALTLADQALYNAKKAGRNCIKVIK
ncbi:GGDEF domain-containing protein [Vibrio metschnikovii]|uniref:GGDEF domain-containing protein n=5 Tax=Unclassified Bacteria TaxID=49928 RepID=A0AAU6T0Z8_UNCXX|nr:GGDEF domain-containing protein [Vibrio metschnikovii]EKO3557556.1 GGDEF domain-containing protein [Vibrio metschnikovii]EKO3565436.1 GGDEF domain-containing protein [Vibrio metschnikovii]EKO3567080.1 GGDEF domain-containing protein [Vibrio metschnikovii]EKO3574857.1 GGDEF domain-containing protein [Vibrio metschnikovii]EKO3586964.1 GGDEF domain-containing protein [Vibrio metschnikovii]